MIPARKAWVSHGGFRAWLWPGSRGGNEAASPAFLTAALAFVRLPWRGFAGEIKFHPS